VPAIPFCYKLNLAVSKKGPDMKGVLGAILVAVALAPPSFSQDPAAEQDKLEFKFRGAPLDCKSPKLDP
jgi:hypothetical protein